MAMYIVSCALRTLNRDYQPLWRALETAGAKRAMEAVWLLDTTSKLDELTKALLPFLTTEDRLFVAEIGAWSATRLLDDTGEWLKQHLP